MNEGMFRVSIWHKMNVMILGMGLQENVHFFNNRGSYSIKVYAGTLMKHFITLGYTFTFRLIIFILSDTKLVFVVREVNLSLRVED